MKRIVPYPVSMKSHRYTVLFAVVFLALGVAWTAAAVPEKRGDSSPTAQNQAAETRATSIENSPAESTAPDSTAASQQGSTSSTPASEEATVETVVESAVEIVPESVVTASSETEKLFNDAVDLYIYAFPAVVLDTVREEMTNRFAFAPINKMAYRTDLPEPGEDGCGIPNRDAFLSSAWFDLEKESQVVLLPAHSRFDFILELYDEWTNVIGSVDSISSADWPVFDYDGRSVKAFAVTGSQNQPVLPEGITVFRSDTPYLWLVNRLLLNETCCTNDGHFAPACRTLYEFEIIKPEEFEKKAQRQTPAKPQAEQSRTLRTAPTELFSTTPLSTMPLSTTPRSKIRFTSAQTGLPYQHRFTDDPSISPHQEKSASPTVTPDQKKEEKNQTEKEKQAAVQPEMTNDSKSGDTIDKTEENKADDGSNNGDHDDDGDTDEEDEENEEETAETTSEFLELTIIPESDGQPNPIDSEKTASPESRSESTSPTLPTVKPAPQPAPQKQPSKTEPTSKPQSRYELYRNRAGRAIWVQRTVWGTEKPVTSPISETQSGGVKKEESQWKKKGEEWKKRGEEFQKEEKERFDRFEEDTARLFRHGYDHSRHWVEEAYDSSREGFEEAHRHLHRDLHRLAALFDEDSLESYPFYYVKNLSGPEFFDRFAKILKTSSASLNPEMAKKLKSIGIVPGESFDREKIDPALRRLLRFVPAVAQMRMDEYLLARMREHEGMGRWVCPMKLGHFGDDFICRARATEKFLGAGTAQEILYPFTFIDSENRPLDGNVSYKIHFNADQLPPAEMGWSLTLYDPNFCLVPNPEHRYSLSSRDSLHFNEDGSLDIVIGMKESKEEESKENAEEKTGENISNFIPTPDGEFMLMMRLYRPKAEALDGRWQVPPVVPVTTDTPK